MSTTRERTVWLLHEPRQRMQREGEQRSVVTVNTEDARAFGVVRPILPASVYPSMAPGPALRDMERALRDYVPGDSLLYAPADPIAPLLAGLVLQAQGLTREPLRWLRWEKHRRPAPGEPAGFYVPVTIDASRL